MDAETARILRRLLEIQIEQTDLLRGLVVVEATHQMNQHVFLYHIGRKLHRDPPEIAASLDRNQETLRELIAELYKAPATAS